jgi:tetratricopeptide (TPR) repeat protein
VSTKILIAALLWAVGLNAQGLDQRVTVTGEIQSGSVPQIGGFVVEVYQSKNHTLAERVMTSGDGRFQIHNVTAGWYTVRVLATPGADPLIEYLQVSHGGAPIVLQRPVRSKEKGPGEIISLRELQHPVNKKAVRCLVEAARYRQRNEPLKAVAKLEEAVRIDPEFRDAHTNLGTEYARAGRVDQAMQHFRRALDIGPPDAIVYSNLSWACLALRQFPEAEEFGRKAIALDAANAKAHLVLGTALALQGGKGAEALKQLQIAAPDEPKALMLIERLRARH